MNWLKGLGSSIWIGILAVGLALAAMSAARSKAEVAKWQRTAVDEKEKDVADSVGKAKAALSQAKLANNRAREAKENARRKLDVIGKKDPELAAVVSGWKSSRLRDSSG